MRVIVSRVYVRIRLKQIKNNQQIKGAYKFSINYITFAVKTGDLK